MTKKICIAPGHGGFDSGAVANGLAEKSLNLSIALELNKLLNTAGVETIMTRTTDVAAGGATTVPGDLSNECRIANDAKVDLFFCIHQNAGGGHGAEAYVYQNSAVADLAKTEVESLSAIMGVHGDPVKTDNNLWVLKNTNMPAILIECGFVDDQANADTYKSHLTEIATSLAPGLIAWAGVAQLASTEQPSQTATDSTTKPTLVDALQQAEDLVTTLKALQ